MNLQREDQPDIFMLRRWIIEQGFFTYTRVGCDSRVLELLADGTIGMGWSHCEQRWRLCVQEGKPRLLFLDETRPTVRLEPAGEAWQGRWLVHEKMPIHFEPLEVTCKTRELERRPEGWPRYGCPKVLSAAQGNVLGREQFDHYWENGFLVMPDLVPVEEVEAFRQVVATTPHLAGSVTPYRHDPFWAYMAKHPRITRVVATLIDGLPRIVQSVLLEKSPCKPGGKGDNATPLHQDRIYLPNRPNTLVGTWLAITDTDPQLAGFRLVPKSHRLGLLEEAAGANPRYQPICLRSPEGREWLYAIPEPDFSDFEDQVLGLKIPAGSVVFFDGFTIHGAYSNRSTSHKRTALATHYVRDGSWVYCRHLQQTVAAYPADGGHLAPRA